MTVTEAGIVGIKAYCNNLSTFTEAGIQYFYLEDMKLPASCTPSTCNGLLCPTTRDGYPSRLFLSQKIACPFPRNWNAENVRIGENDWFAFSWNTGEGLTLPEMLAAHLAAFTKEK